MTSPITNAFIFDIVADVGDATAFPETLCLPDCVAKYKSNVDSSGRPATNNMRSVSGSVNVSEPAAAATSPALTLAFPASISSGVGIAVLVIGSTRGTATKKAVPARSKAIKSLNVLVPFRYSTRGYPDGNKACDDSARVL